MNRQEFSQSIAYLEAGVGSGLGRPQMEVWFEQLGDLPAEALQKAVKRYLHESEYPGLPPIGKLRRLATEARDGQCLGHGDAFDRLMTAIRRYGFYGQLEGLDSLDRLTRQALNAIGGWQAVCDSPVDQRSQLRAQFRMAYEQITASDNRQRALPADLRPTITNNRERLPEVKLLEESLSSDTESEHDAA